MHMRVMVFKYKILALVDNLAGHTSLCIQYIGYPMAHPWFIYDIKFYNTSYSTPVNTSCNCCSYI